MIFVFVFESIRLPCRLALSQLVVEGYNLYAVGSSVHAVHYATVFAAI